LQENVLFNRSVREYRARSRDGRAIRGASPGARFILELSDGYDTIIGERGSTSSGGPAPASPVRALVTDPRILIFDGDERADSERAHHPANMKGSPGPDGQSSPIGSTVRRGSHRHARTRPRGRDGTHARIKTGGRYASCTSDRQESMKSTKLAIAARPTPRSAFRPRRQ
jgi:subfamily B ATP-binding cassette protein HlyB/CyaB